MKNNIVRLTLPRGSRYDIAIGSGAISQLGSAIRSVTSYDDIALISDSNVSGLYSAKVASILEQDGFAVAQFAFEAGEQSKSLSRMEELFTALADYRFSRNTVIVAFGGGVTGDLAGFVASTYMRGVPFVQVPTTLLAMVDSSVGGKNGVNVAGIKNLVGNFNQPIYVVADTDMLSTLPDLEWKCGFAEMAKSAIIDSQEFSTWLFDKAPLLTAHDPDALRDAITKTVEFKARVVVEDEHESSRRKCLNYGHTLGHAIEAISQNPKVLHGIAVAEGMRFAAFIAAEVCGVLPGFAEAQDSLLSVLGIEPMTRKFDVDEMVDLMLHDKKSDGQTISFVLAKSPGVWSVQELDPEFVRSQLVKWMDRK